MPSIIWFREDLRITDNTALYHATRNSNDGVIAVYIICKKAWQEHDIAACRVDFILRNLRLLSESLAELHIPLIIIDAESYQAVPELLLKFMQKQQADSLYFNQQYELNEARRDLAVEQLLKKNSLKTFSYTDQLILAPGEVLTNKSDYYTVFTPFKNAWFKQFAQHQFSVLPKPGKQKPLTIKADKVPAKLKDFTSAIDPDLWPAGEKEAHRRLKKFIENKINFYDQQRDFPAIDGTSQLSAYLTSGIISPRQCLQAALESNNQQLNSGNSGITTWINELVWREFYKHVLHGFPRVSMHRAFKLNTENIAWDNNEKLFNAWCEGKTGYPLVDAAMRQMNTIGWMHNRLRMLTAMFLVKDLLIDWRLGEKYFMQNLIDGDLSANNGGWQWAASTGTDAVPYFRIFNPTSQSQKFDPEGKFIRTYCPELKSLDKKVIHEPYQIGSLLFNSLNYPKPIIQHNAARLRTLKVFKMLK